jgi:hypothetical protein
VQVLFEPRPEIRGYFWSKMREEGLPTISAVANDIRPVGFDMLLYLCEAGGTNLQGLPNSASFSCPRWDKMAAMLDVTMLAGQVDLNGSEKPPVAWYLNPDGNEVLCT